MSASLIINIRNSETIVNTQFVQKNFIILPRQNFPDPPLNAIED